MSSRASQGDHMEAPDFTADRQMWRKVAQSGRGGLRRKEQPLERVVHGRAVAAHATEDRRAHSWT